MKGKYATELVRYAADHKLTQAQKDELQQQINELYGVFSYVRDNPLLK